MKYPWTALALVIIWLATTYIILRQDNLDVNYILVVTLIGTIIIAFIGFRPPAIRK